MSAPPSDKYVGPFHFQIPTLKGDPPMQYLEQFNPTNPNDDQEFVALSETSGIYFTDNEADPNIIDGSSLEIKSSEEVALRKEQELISGQGFDNRENLIKHPDIDAYLAVEGYKDENGIKIYSAFYTYDFKRVTCVDYQRKRCQGNPKWTKGSEATKEANKQSVINRKKRLTSVSDACKKMKVEPGETLVNFAKGDWKALGLDGSKISEKDKAKLQYTAAVEIMGYVQAKPKGLALDNDKDKKGNQNGTIVFLPEKDGEKRKEPSKVVGDDPEDYEDEYDE